MAFDRITDAERVDKGVTGLPDTPGLTTTALQTKFDELGNMAIDGVNNLADELEATTAAGNIGAVVPDGVTSDPDMQSIIDALATEQGGTAAELGEVTQGEYVSPDNTFGQNINALDDQVADNSDIIGTATLATTATTLTEAINELKAVNDDEDLTISGHETRIGDAEGNITSLGNRVTTAEGNITSLGNRMTTAEGDIDSLETTVSGHGTRLTTAENDIDALETTVSGHTTSIGTIQNSLTADETEIAANTAARHSHSNKTVLDTITSTLVTAWNNLVTLFSSITGVQNTVADSSTELVTGHAVVNYVSGLGGGDMMKSTYDTDNDGVVDNSEALDGHAASYFATAEGFSNLQETIQFIALLWQANMQILITYESKVSENAYTYDADNPKYIAWMDEHAQNAYVGKIIADIAVGDTLTNGTNVSLVNNIADLITELPASYSVYDNTTSGLTATKTQAAIDEVVSDLATTTTTANAAKSVTDGIKHIDSFTIPSGATSYTISNANITANSEIIITFTEATLEYAENAGLLHPFTQAAGSLTIYFENALEADVVATGIIFNL